MRIADIVLRQGHLSEAAITRSVLEGRSEAHLERCDLCARRAHDLGRWLDESRAAIVAEADAHFPAERLAAQQSNILRRLAQIDEPARVLAFPAAPAPQSRPAPSRRVAPAWVGVAAAAGLVVGVVGGQLAARLESVRTSGAVASSTPAVVEPPIVVAPVDAGPVETLLEMDLERPTPNSLRSMDDMTPRLVPVSFTLAQRN